MEKKAHYIDNQKFLEELKKHKANVLAAKEQGLEKPIVPNYIGECFIKIGNHLSYKSNFINYTFKDEMISDGIENCLSYVDNFDPSRSSNPFAYFTQITYYAFVRRIQKEKKQLATKYKYIESLDISDIITQGHDEGEFSNGFIEYLKSELDNVDPAQRTIKTKSKAKPKPVSGELDFGEE
jgi:hypothetical protein